jgi:hypothetical protein
MRALVDDIRTAFEDEMNSAIYIPALKTTFEISKQDESTTFL